MGVTAMNPDNAEVGGFTASNVRGGATATGPTSSEEVDALLSLFPGPLTLWPDRVRTLRGLVLTFIFVMTAMVLVVLLPPIATKQVGFLFAMLGGWAMVMAVRLLPGAFKLTLDKNGVERVSLFLAFRKSWQHVDTMTIWRMSHRHIVPHGPRMQGVGSDASGLSNNNGSRPLLRRVAALSNSYNLSAKELTALMSRWRARALDH
jgi:hypothetical protein